MGAGTVDRFWSHSIWRAIFFAVLAFLLIHYVYFSIYNQFDNDEFEAVHTAWKINHGEHIYTGFFQHHHPLLYYTLVPYIRIFGETPSAIMAMRVTMMILALAAIACTYLLAKKAFGADAAMISVFLMLTSYTFLAKGRDIRPDTPQNLLGLVAVLLLVYYLADRQRIYLAASASALALGFIFSQKIIFLCLLIGAALPVLYFERKLTTADLITYFAISGIIAAAFLLIFVAAGIFHEYFVYNWAINANFLDHFSPMKGLGRELKLSNWWWLAFAAGLVFAVRTFEQKFIAYFAVGLLASFFLVRSPYRQYLVPAIGFMSVIGGGGIAALCGKVRFGREWVPAVLAIIAVINILALWEKPNTAKRNAQFAQISFVTRTTGMDDCVYDGSARFNVFRPDMDFFWFSVGRTGGLATYRKMGLSYPYDCIGKIVARKPVVISDYCLDCNDSKISSRYGQSPFKRIMVRR
jgi:4-amino-4-deoxy-L-arabinose transferase-like glycosyltransferase